MLEQKGPMIKDTHLTVEDFIARSSEVSIKKFFMEDIDVMLERYDPGRPKYKPDVLEQTKQLEIQRKQMIEQKQMTPINIVDPTTGEKKYLTMDQVVMLLRDMENTIGTLQNTIMQQRQYIEQQHEFITTMKKKIETISTNS
jgi:hypothetical protein